MLLPLDAVIVGVSYYIALPMRFAGMPPANYLESLWYLLPYIALGYALVNYCFGLYHRIWRYAGAADAVPIVASASTATLAVLAIDEFSAAVLRPLPLSTVLLGGFLTMVGFLAVRFHRPLMNGFQDHWRELPRVRSGGQRVLVVGAGEAGQLLASRLLYQPEGRAYALVGFVDDDLGKHGLRIHGRRVLGNRSQIPEIVETHEVDLIVIAAYNISGEEFRGILKICEETPAVIKVLPNFFDFLQPHGGSAPIRDLTAEDLLGRKVVQTDRESCRRLLADKTVLVTGAAGSIGSELSRQIIHFAPSRLILLDNNESGLHDLVISDFKGLASEEIAGGERESRVVPIVADVTNEAKMRRIFARHTPEIVFHAAAYKHVPLMEANPDEAVRVNVWGTLITAELAREYDVETFVLVSTDKAINPTSVMGASKRLCELLVAEMGAACADDVPGTQFTAVRFGNVLGSRGSVVPTFERQIEAGGPVTVTHREMTRYFMTIHEAASLIIQAAALTRGRDLFMLDMGERIRIEELARRLIRLRGLRPEVDVPIVYTGPRPGEKMHEELLGHGEERQSTSHPHVFRISGSGAADDVAVRARVMELVALAEAERGEEIAARLMSLPGIPILGNAPEVTH